MEVYIISMKKAYINWLAHVFNNEPFVISDIFWFSFFIITRPFVFLCLLLNIYVFKRNKIEVML